MKAGAEASTGRLFFLPSSRWEKNLMRVWHIYGYKNIYIYLCMDVHVYVCLIICGQEWRVCLMGISGEEGHKWPHQTVRVLLFLFCGV